MPSTSSGPAVNAVIEINPDALKIADALDQERRTSEATRPAARHPGAHQGQHRHRRPHDDHRRLARPAWLRSAERRLSRAQAAPGRRAHSRQDQSQRVGQHSLQPLHQRMERTRRPDPQSLRARPQSLRFQFRLRRGRFRQRSAPSPSARKLPAPSSARRTPTASLASSPPSAWSAAPSVIPISHTQDTAGPMARTVADAAALLSALAGYDPQDPATAPLRDKPAVDYTRSLDPAWPARRPHRRRTQEFRFQRRRRSHHGGLSCRP